MQSNRTKWFHRIGNMSGFGLSGDAFSFFTKKEMTCMKNISNLLKKYVAVATKH